MRFWIRVWNLPDVTQGVDEMGSEVGVGRLSFREESERWRILDSHVGSLSITPAKEDGTCLG